MSALPFGNVFSLFFVKKTTIFTVDQVHFSIMLYEKHIIEIPTNKGTNVYLCFQGFGPQCGSLFEFLLPVIKLSTDTSLPEHVYLMDDGLELWHTTLINTTRITPPLLHLYKNMAELLRK